MANPYPITPRQLDLVNLSGSHLTQQGVYPDIKMGVVSSYNVSSGSAETVLKSTASGGLTLGSLNVQGNATLRNVLPENTDTYDLGSSINLWRKGWLSELDTVIFAENTASLIGGWLIIGKNQGSIPSFVDSTDTTIDFGKTMTVGGSVVFRSSLQVEYIGTGSLSSGSTVYNVVRDLDGSGANDWVEGSAFLVLGESGDGRIELNAYDTPRIQMIQQGETYNQQKEIIRIGDLNGNWNYSSEEWGVAIGSYGSGSGNVTIDSTNGVKINIYDTPIMEFKSTGAFISNVLNMNGANAAITIGDPVPVTSGSGTGLWLDRTGLYALNSDMQKAVLDNVGLRFGNVSGSFLSWLDDDGVNLTATDYTGGSQPSNAPGSQLLWNNPIAGYAGDVPYPIKIQGFVSDTGSSMPATMEIGIQSGIAGSKFSVYCGAYTGLSGGNGGLLQIGQSSGVIQFVSSGVLATTRMAIDFNNDKTITVSGDRIYANALYPWHKLNEGVNYVAITYVSATSILITQGDYTDLFTIGTKIKFDQTTTKYFYVLSSSYDAGNVRTTVTVTGVGTYTVANADISNFFYSHSAEADIPIGSSTFIPLSTPLTSTSWDGDSFSTTAKTLIDLSAVFGVPAGVKAVVCNVAIRDSGSAANDCILFLGAVNTANVGMVVRCSGQANDSWSSASVTVPCNANGDIYYQVTASGAGTMDIHIQVYGYFI